MSRPKPTIIMSMPQGSKIIDVCTSDAVYAVFYQGQPIKVRRRTTTNDYDGPKYFKTHFPESGHAFNLADRLNALFQCEDFAVYKLREGRKIEEK
jgi:hypothetical protein